MGRWDTLEGEVLGREVDNIYTKKICQTNLPPPPPTQRGALGCNSLTVRKYVNKRFFVCFRVLAVLNRKMNKLVHAFFALTRTHELRNLATIWCQLFQETNFLVNWSYQSDQF